MPRQHPTPLKKPASWRLTCVAAATLGAALVTPAGLAQTSKQAQSILQKTDLTELQRLQQAFQAKYEADEAAVKAYLDANTGVSRAQIIDGKVHTIVRIDGQGQPVFQVGRDVASKASVISRKNTESATQIKADSLYPGGSLGVSITGQNMVAGVWEPGLPRVNHELLLNKATIQGGQATPTDATDADNVGGRNHATHVTGTMVGNDFTQDTSKSADARTARGIAFGATSKNWDANNDLAEMAAAAGDANTPLLVSNHSYGDPNTRTGPSNLWFYGAYNNEAQGWDQLLKAAPMYLPFIAGGNEQQRSGNPGKMGYDIMTGSSAAKNTMTVGAVNADSTMSDYSNWGPTDDGRVKPEIVARGTGIDSAQAFDATPAPSTTAYSGSGVDSSGTSYAAPAAAAAALLLQQYYASVNNGQYMLASTLKSLIMGTATDLGQPGPDYKFGYGLMNTEAAAQAIKNNSTTVIGTNCSPSVATGTNCSLTTANSKGALVYEWKANPAADNSSEMAFSFPAKGGTPLVVNLGWTDDEGPEQVAGDGVDNTTSRMVYDFDMKLRTPASAFIRPWVLPGIGNPSADATVATGAFQANGGPFRQVIIAAPVAGGTYILYVNKKAGSPATTRNLSLVVTGLAEPAGINGACGTASGTTPTATAPATNLCAAGTNTTVTGNNNGKWNWDCNGSGGGTSTSNFACAAPYGSQSINLSANPTTIAVGGTSAITASSTAGLSVGLEPNANCSIAGTTVTATNVGTCTVTASQSGTGDTGTSRYAAAVTQSVNIAVNPASVNGQCGAANGVATALAPRTNLCTAGTATAVNDGSPWTWTCQGTGNGTLAQCAAPNAAAGTGTGRVSGVTSLQEGGGWVITGANFSNTPPATPPAGVTLPNGILSLNLASGTPGTGARVTITYSSPVPAGAVYWKYGKEPGNTANHWYQYPNAVINGNTVTLTLTDGAQGDNDLTANGLIADPGGIGIAIGPNTAIIPTLSEYALMALGGVMLLLGLRSGPWRMNRRV